VSLGSGPTEIAVAGLLVFLIIWIVATLLLSRIAWFRRPRPKRPKRLQPYVDPADAVQDIEDWLRQQADS
jgi:hypothetical protein